MGRCVNSRHLLGVVDAKKGDMNRERKYWMIAAKAVHELAMSDIKSYYTKITVTKQEYQGALRAYQELNEGKTLVDETDSLE